MKNSRTTYLTSYQHTKTKYEHKLTLSGRRNNSQNQLPVIILKKKFGKVSHRKTNGTEKTNTKVPFLPFLVKKTNGR